MSESQRPRSIPPSSGRAQILRAALEEFAERGFDGASTGQIAKRAGVTQPLIHHHFGTKVDLWKAAVDEGFAELSLVEASLRDALSTLDPSTRLRVMVRQLVLHGLRHPELTRILVFESGRETETSEYALERHVRPFAERLVAAIDEGMKDGRFRTLDPRLVLVAGLGAASYLSLVPAQARGLFDLDVADPITAERYADLVVDMLLHGISLGDRKSVLPEP